MRKDSDEVEGVTVAEYDALLAENERLVAALEDAECDLETLKLLGHKLGSYEKTRIKIRTALAATKG